MSGFSRDYKHPSTADQLAEAKDTIDGLGVELDSALRKLSAVLIGGKNADEAAWWLCANHAKFVLDHPNLYTPRAKDKLIEMAARAGMPPKGGTWVGWFERVSKISD